MAAVRDITPLCFLSMMSMYKFYRSWKLIRTLSRENINPIQLQNGLEQTSKHLKNPTSAQAAPVSGFRRVFQGPEVPTLWKISLMTC